MKTFPASADLGCFLRTDVWQRRWQAATIAEPGHLLITRQCDRQLAPQNQRKHSEELSEGTSALYLHVCDRRPFQVGVRAALRPGQQKRPRRKRGRQAGLQGQFSDTYRRTRTVTGAGMGRRFLCWGPSVAPSGRRSCPAGSPKDG